MHRPGRVKETGSGQAAARPLDSGTARVYTRLYAMQPASPRRGSVFYKYLLSYLVIMLIPVVMSVFVFAGARAVLMEEAARANDLLLKQMQSQLDMVLADVGRLSYMVTSNDRLEGLMQEGPPLDGHDYYLAYLASNDFQTYRVASNDALDFYVYLPGLDMVICPEGYFSSRNYHVAQMSRLGYSYAEWMERLRRVTRQSSYMPSRMETDTNAVIDTIAVVAPLPAAKPTGISRGWLVVHLEERVFRDAFRNTAWTDRSLLAVYHRTQGIVVDSGTAVPPEVLESAAQGEVRIGGVPYVCIRRKSEAAGLEYVSLVPTDLYAVSFRRLTRYTAIAFAACLLVGIAVLYWFTVLRYRPVRGLLSILAPMAALPRRGADEFDQIGASIRLTLDEDRHLREEADRSKPVLAGRLLRELLMGQCPEDGEAARELARLGVSLPPGRAVLALAEVDGQPGDPVARERAEQAVCERAAEAGAFVVRGLDGAVGLLLGAPGDGDGGLRDLAARAKADAEGRHPVHVAVGMSGAHPREEGLKILYDEARAALGFWLVRGSDQPIAFRDLPPSSRSYDYPIEEETRLINSIRAGDSAGATAILDGIYARNLGQTPLSIEMARCLMFDLISTMVKAVDSIMTHDNDPAFWSRLRPVARLTACRSFERLREEMGDIERSVCEHVIRSRTRRNDRLREEILAFIHAGYRDKNLCPEAIAAHLRRNAAYLSRFFRGQMSMGVSSYIKRHRVAEARALLADGGLTLGEIADRVGFAGSDALIRAFREVEGVTPGRFRVAGGS